MSPYVHTQNYYQPDFYHFCEHSIALAHFAAQKIETKSPLQVLDLFSGCGVIGLEFASLVSHYCHLDFVEKNTAYQESFLLNIQATSATYQIYWSDVFDWSPTKKYDVILLNPPFYFQGEVRESPCRDRCQSQIMNKENFFALLARLKSWLNPYGKIFILGPLAWTKGNQLLYLEKKMGRNALYSLI